MHAAFPTGRIQPFGYRFGMSGRAVRFRLSKRFPFRKESGILIDTDRFGRDHFTTFFTLFKPAAGTVNRDFFPDKGV